MPAYRTAPNANTALSTVAGTLTPAERAAIVLIVRQNRTSGEAAWHFGVDRERLLDVKADWGTIAREMEDAEFDAVLAAHRAPRALGLYAPPRCEGKAAETWDAGKASTFLYGVARGMSPVECRQLAGLRPATVALWMAAAEEDPFRTFVEEMERLQVARVALADETVLDVMENGADSARLKAAELVKTWANPERYAPKSTSKVEHVGEVAVQVKAVSVLAELSSEDLVRLFDAERQARVLVGASE